RMFTRRPVYHHEANPQVEGDVAVVDGDAGVVQRPGHDHAAATVTLPPDVVQVQRVPEPAVLVGGVPRDDQIAGRNGAVRGRPVGTVGAVDVVAVRLHRHAGLQPAVQVAPGPVAELHLPHQAHVAGVDSPPVQGLPVPGRQLVALAERGAL